MRGSSALGGLSAADGLALSLFVLTVAYMAWQVLFGPFIGYANNYDFVRQSGCVGLWQSIEGVDKTFGHPQFPTRWLHYDGDRRAYICMHSIDNVFPYLATVFARVGDAVALWHVAIWKLVCLCVTVGVLLWQAVRLRLVLSVVFALVFSDWVYLAYANTLYLEFSVITASFLVLASTLCIVTAPGFPSRGILLLSVLALLWLGLSKQQYTPLAVLASCFVALVSWQRWRAARLAAVFIGLAISVLLAFGLLNPSSSGLMSTINQANKTNTFMATVLPSASDKPAALERLGLPRECLGDIGRNWYSIEAGGPPPCPAVAEVSRAHLLTLFIEQPQTLWMPLHHIIAGTRPLYPDYLGVLEPGGGKAATDKLEWARATSLSTYLARLPEPVYQGLVYACLSGGVLASLWLLLGIFRGRCAWERSGPLAMLALGGIAALYALFSSVFGDGYIEMQKHAVVFAIGWTFQWVALAWYVGRWLLARWPRRWARP